MYGETYEPIHKASIALWNDVVTHFLQKQFFVQSLPEKQLGTFFHWIPLQMSSMIISSVEATQKGL